MDMFKAMDTDKSGFLEKEEVRHYWKDICTQMQIDDQLQEDDFEAGFSRLDTSGDARLEFEELFNWFREWAYSRGLLARSQ